MKLTPNASLPPLCDAAETFWAVTDALSSIVKACSTWLHGKVGPARKVLKNLGVWDKTLSSLWHLRFVVIVLHELKLHALVLWTVLWEPCKVRVWSVKCWKWLYTLRRRWKSSWWSLHSPSKVLSQASTLMAGCDIFRLTWCSSMKTIQCNHSRLTHLIATWKEVPVPSSCCGQLTNIKFTELQACSLWGWGWSHIESWSHNNNKSALCLHSLEAKDTAQSQIKKRCFTAKYPNFEGTKLNWCWVALYYSQFLAENNYTTFIEFLRPLLCFVWAHPSRIQSENSYDQPAACTPRHSVLCCSRSLDALFGTHQVCNVVFDVSWA